MSRRTKAEKKFEMIDKLLDRGVEHEKVPTKMKNVTIHNNNMGNLILVWGPKKTPQWSRWNGSHFVGTVRGMGFLRTDIFAADVVAALAEHGACSQSQAKAFREAQRAHAERKARSKEIANAVAVLRENGWVVEE